MLCSVALSPTKIALLPTGPLFLMEFPNAHLLAFTVNVANGGPITRFASNVKVRSSDRLVALLLQPHEIGRHNALMLLFVDGVEVVTHWAQKISIR